MSSGKASRAPPSIASLAERRRSCARGRCLQRRPRHPQTPDSIYNLAELLKKMGRVVEAIPLFREHLEGCRENGATHDDTLLFSHNLAKLLDESGRPEEAARLRSEYGV